MSNIHENLQKILHAVWGKDVRQAIHDAIHDCYEDGSAGSTDLIAREEIEELEATKATRIELAEETADRLAEVAIERGRIDNLVTSGTGVTNATKRTETTLFSASVPCFGNVSGYSGYFDIEDAIENYDYIKIRYNAFGRTGIVDCKPADISASGTIGSTVFHWSEIQPNWETTSLDNPRTVFRHMDFSAVNISSGNTHRLSVDAVVFGWNGDATSNGKISDSFVISWDSSKSLHVASGFTGGIYSIIGVKYTDAGVDKDTELTDIRTGADGTVYQTAGGAVRGQIEDITNRLNGVESNFGDEYDSTATYAVGDRCVHEGVWYECNTAISTAEEWTEAHWDKVSLADITDQVAQNTSDISDLKEELNGFIKENLLITCDIVSKNTQGITYTKNVDGSYTISGTAKATSFANIYFNAETALPGIEPYVPYWLDYDAGNSGVYMRFIKYDGTTLTVLTNTGISRIIVFTADDLAKGMIIRFFITSGTTVDITVTPRLTRAMTNTDLQTGNITAGNKYPYNGLSGCYKTIANMALNGSVPIDVTSVTNFLPLSTRLITMKPFSFETDTVVRCNSGYRFRLLTVENGVATVDDGVWRTSAMAKAGIEYLLYGSKTDNSNEITLDECINFYADILGQKVDEIEDCALKYTIENYLITDNPMLKYYNQFQHKNVDTSTKVFYFSTYNAGRMNAILTLEKPLHITMINPDYVMRIYWYDGDTLCSTEWASHIDIPAGQVALVIKSVADGDISAENPQYYILPNSIYSVPKDYYEEEIADTVAKIEKYNTEPGLCYLLSTDQHTMAVQGTLQKYDTLTDMAVNMREIAKHITFDANISLGDIADFKWNNTTNLFTRYGLINTTADEADAVFKAWLDYGMEQLIAIHPNMYYVMGNHDDNRYINKDRLQETVSSYDYTPEKIHAYYMSHAIRSRVSDTNLCGVNYYVDQDNYKIRILCLDSNMYYGDTPNPVTGYTGWWYGFNDETVSFASSALNSLPSGYSVLVFCHQSSIKDHNGDNAAYTNFANMKSVFQTFVDGGGKLIAWLYGHQHADWQTADPWLEICFNCQKAQQNNVSEFPTVMRDAVSPPRTAGTATEDCWNVLMIKPNSNVINQIRFGAGNDRHFHYDYQTVSGTTTLTSMLHGTLTWGSKNETVATVSNGTVTSVASGRTLIYATNEDGDTEYWCIAV